MERLIYIFVHMERFYSTIIKYDLEKCLPNLVIKGVPFGRRGRKTRGTSNLSYFILKIFYFF